MKKVYVAILEEDDGILNSILTDGYQINKYFFIHNRYKSWTLSHKSGYCIKRNMSSMASCKALAEELDNKLDWDVCGVNDKDFTKQDISEILAIREKHQ